MYLLHIETPNFNFHVIEHTPEAAKAAFKDYWPTHCENTGAELEYGETLLSEHTPIYITPGFVSVDHSEAPKA